MRSPNQLSIQLNPNTATPKEIGKNLFTSWKFSNIMVEHTKQVAASCRHWERVPEPIASYQRVEVRLH